MIFELVAEDRFKDIANQSQIPESKDFFASLLLLSARLLATRESFYEH